MTSSWFYLFLLIFFTFSTQYTPSSWAQEQMAPAVPPRPWSATALGWLKPVSTELAHISEEERAEEYMTCSQGSKNICLQKDPCSLHCHNWGNKSIWGAPFGGNFALTAYRAS